MESTTKQILTDTIHINPSDINVKNINGLILVKIKQFAEKINVILLDIFYKIVYNL